MPHLPVDPTGLSRIFRRVPPAQVSAPGSVDERLTSAAYDAACSSREVHGSSSRARHSLRGRGTIDAELFGA